MKIDMAHTPGPWKWANDDPPHYRSTRIVAGDRDRFTVLEVQEGQYYSELTGSDPPTLEISDADRYLIVAAPELLAALKLTRGTNDLDWLIEQIDPVIAKAEGRTAP